LFDGLVIPEAKNMKKIRGTCLWTCKFLTHVIVTFGHAELMPLYMYVWEMNLKECVNVHKMTNNPHDTCIFLRLA